MYKLDYMLDDVKSSWKKFILRESKKDYFQNLLNKLNSSDKLIFPFVNNIFENVCNLINSNLSEDLEKNENETHNKQLQESKVSLITPITIPEQIYNIYTQC